jgi:7-carboxy-7-deazaguanine synthase
MPLTLIEQKPAFDKKVQGEDKLAIAEMFCDTLQGEGINVGVPSTFIRLQGCTLQCKWCDTLDVWPHGNEYSFGEIFLLMEEVNLIRRLKTGQHLILTGGSPLKQENRLTRFLTQFIERYGFKPYVEIENEAVLMPYEIIPHIDCWNNSPKLSNSGMKEKARYKLSVLAATAQLKNSWFKFVISDENDWREVERDFLMNGLIKKNQTILMPEGITQHGLLMTRETVADLAIKHGVRFTDRLHITLWNKKTGV